MLRSSVQLATRSGPTWPRDMRESVTPGDMSEPSQIGRYEILGLIGHGGMGTLYRAWDPKLERQIAIKLLRGDNDELRERFAREARSAARLRHRHIVMIYDVGDHLGQPFIALEYIEGQTLAELVASRAPLPVVRKLELIEELCDGLAYAHQIGIIHRDVKPANAMVDTGGTLKILDFGIARLAEQSGMTQVGMLIGTLNYMSPEQVTGVGVDKRSDIFAVGAVLYELLAFRQAFPGGLQDGILHRIVEGRREPLDNVCRGLDMEVVQVVDRALAIDVERRYQDLALMRKDLQRVRQRLNTAGDAVHPSPMDVPTVVVDPRPVTPTPRRGAGREDFARRRAEQIHAKFDAASRAFTHGDFDAALALAEEVLLLDADDARAADLHDRAKIAIDERQANELVSDAERERSLGNFTQALRRIDDALAFSSSHERASQLRQTILADMEKRELAARAREAIDRARARFEAGELTDAIAASDEALALEPGSPEAIAIRTRALDAIAARERQLEERRREAERRRREQRIANELAVAQQEMQQQQFSNALGRLHALETAEGRTPETAAAIAAAAAGQVALERKARIAREVREHLDRGHELLKARNWAGALSEAERACSLEPENESARDLRSNTREAIGRENQRRAAEERRVRERQLTMATALERARNAPSPDEAIAALRTVLAIDPQHADARLLMAQQEAELDRLRIEA
ncbi:MAG TPA: serine/threonine-protein kinase, partial [Vicinamibacterales bacterium]|nr:serine/threonine-protein kinase [Vicinamibacterales bacterium]